MLSFSRIFIRGEIIVTVHVHVVPAEQELSHENLPRTLVTPLSVSQVLNSHSHVMYILSILLAKYTEIKVSLKSRKTMA